MPKVIRNTGTIPKSINKYCNILDCNIDMTIIQKQTALKTV